MSYPQTRPKCIWAVVVTFNRKELLRSCVESLLAQSRKPDRILIVDNASTDGTLDMLITSGLLEHEVEHLPLSENGGGAGGFSAGLQHSIRKGAHWIWMMDDDASPYPTALEELMEIAVDTTNVYGSLAVNGEDTSWTTTLLGENPRIVDKLTNVPEQSRVQSLPFLGFLIHRDLVNKIGLPDAGYFIAADDIEYCMRAERAGAEIIIAGKSRIEHPKSERYIARVPGRKLICLKLPPWKRYYDTRNRLLIARKYYGIKLVTQTIPGSFMRLWAALVHEPRKLSQLWAFTAGFVDGLLGLKGKRHNKWGIGQ
ncbi:glycosyltransferase [Rhodanobacter sp. Root627]|uniref:glycosyltransferase n=1 Tax=Rhodanobacter sp. Root627 TaxID=1736572 RepID=UPI00138EF3B0|nr:glycosyltransferase [Rhodanobacter sp. Root627]